MPTTPAISDEQRDAAEQALDRVNQMRTVEGNRINDPALNELLDPLRDLTIGSACGTCFRDLVWMAVDSRAFVAPFQHRCPPKQRRGGITDCAVNASPLGQSKAPWILLAESGTTIVKLEDISTMGYPLRIRIACLTCQAEHVSTNTARLTRFLTTVSSGTGKMTLFD